MKKISFAFILIVSLSFSAGWQSVASALIAFMTAFLILMFTISHVFGLEREKLFIKDEFVQLFLTVLLIISIQTIESSFDFMFSSLKGGKTTLNDFVMYSIKEDVSSSEQLFDSLKSFSSTVGRESGRNYYCDFLDNAVFMSPCGAYSTLSPIIAIAIQTVSYSIIERSALLAFLDFSKNFALSVFLPLGILLRFIHYTRGAGGILIAFSFTSFFIVPLALSVYYAILSDFELSHPELSVSQNINVLQKNLKLEDCKFLEDSTDDGTIISRIKDKFDDLFNNNNFSRLFVYIFIVRGTFPLAVAITVLVSGTTSLGRVFGSEVNAGSLGRLI